ncbi:hypothetical protein DFH28DRAFT_922864 [Melampsora americana]|nr:hypothetical protein DFH28DRAFT_922864 [Melampsora americana]
MKESSEGVYISQQWDLEYTSRDKIACSVSTKAKLQEVFPSYCQHRSTINEVNAVVSDSKKSNTKAPNLSDLDKKELGGLLNGRLLELLGYLPAKGFPRIPNPVFAIKDHKIPIIVERAQDSKMTDKVFLKGFNGMNASERRLWLADIASGKFQIKKAPIQISTTGASASGSDEPQSVGASNGPTNTEATRQGGADTNTTASIDANRDGDTTV